MMMERLTESTEVLNIERTRNNKLIASDDKLTTLVDTVNGIADQAIQEHNTLLMNPDYQDVLQALVEKELSKLPKMEYGNLNPTDPERENVITNQTKMKAQLEGIIKPKSEPVKEPTPKYDNKDKLNP